MIKYKEYCLWGCDAL